MISVIIPSFNYAHFLGEAIESVVGQSYKNWEVVVVDDASQDATYEMMKKYLSKKIRYFRNDKNLGVDQTIARGLEESMGEYVCFLSADDWLPKVSLEVRVAQLIRDHANAVHGGLTRVEGQKKTYISPVNTRIKNDYVNFLKGTMKLNQGINNATFLWEKDGLGIIYSDLKKDPYNHNDYELALKTINTLKTTVVMSNTYNYRIHERSLLGQMKKLKGWKEAKTQLEKKDLPTNERA